MASWTIISQAVGLLACSLMAASALADHESSKQPPLWTPLDDAERMAAMEIPGGMAVVPGGSFLMGSDPQKDRAAGPQEFPQRRVYLDAFEIGKYEVTTLEYLKFVLATNRLPQLDWCYDGGNFQEAMAYHPVMHVSWYDADAFCRGAESQET